MHKHFRMIAISENLRSHGFMSPADEHMRPAGIWKKLEGLYSLEALDQREDGFGYPSTSDSTEELFVDFDLPEEDYWDMMFARRLAPAGTSSPPALPFQTVGSPATHPGRRHSTVDDSEG
jgi:MRG-binding protein